MMATLIANLYSRGNDGNCLTFSMVMEMMATMIANLDGHGNAQ